MSAPRSSLRRRLLFLTRAHPLTFCTVCKRTHEDAFKECGGGTASSPYAVAPTFIPFVNYEDWTDETGPDVQIIGVYFGRRS